MKNWNKSIWTGLIFGIFSVAYLIAAFQVKTATSRFGIFDGGFMPKLYGLVMLACSVTQLAVGIREYRKGVRPNQELTPEEIKDRRINSRHVLYGFILIFLYIFSMKTLGFILSSAVFLFCLCNLLLPLSKPRTKKLMLGFAVFSIVFPIVSYLFFKKVVFMALPQGTIFKAISKLF